MHLTPKDEEPLFTAESLDLYEIISRPAASRWISRSNSLCEKASTHEKALLSDQSAEWIGR